MGIADRDIRGSRLGGDGSTLEHARPGAGASNLDVLLHNRQSHHRDHPRPPDVLGADVCLRGRDSLVRCNSFHSSPIVSGKNGKTKLLTKRNQRHGHVVSGRDDRAKERRERRDAGHRRQPRQHHHQLQHLAGPGVRGHRRGPRQPWRQDAGRLPFGYRAAWYLGIGFSGLGLLVNLVFLGRERFWKGTGGGTERERVRVGAL